MQVEALSSLTRLRHLDLGNNRLVSLHAVSGLSQLSQLSIEANQLKNLSGAQGMHGLMELYAANNHITEIKVGEHKLTVLAQFVHACHVL